LKLFYLPEQKPTTETGHESSIIEQSNGPLNFEKNYEGTKSA